MAGVSTEGYVKLWSAQSPRSSDRLWLKTVCSAVCRRKCWLPPVKVRTPRPRAGARRVSDAPSWARCDGRGRPAALMWCPPGFRSAIMRLCVCGPMPMRVCRSAMPLLRALDRRRYGRAPADDVSSGAGAVWHTRLMQRGRPAYTDWSESNGGVVGQHAERTIRPVLRLFLAATEDERVVALCRRVGAAPAACVRLWKSSQAD